MGSFIKMRKNPSLVSPYEIIFRIQRRKHFYLVFDILYTYAINIYNLNKAPYKHSVSL